MKKKRAQRITAEIERTYIINDERFVLLEFHRNQDRTGIMLQLMFMDEETFDTLNVQELMEARRNAKQREFEEEDLKIQKEINQRIKKDLDDDDPPKVADFR